MHLQQKNLVVAFLFISGLVAGIDVSYADKKSDSTVYHNEVRKIDSLIPLIEYYYDFNIDTSYLLSQEILKRAVSIHYLKGQQEALMGIVTYYATHDNFLKAFEILFSNLELHLKNNLMPEYINTHVTLSSLFLRLNDTAKSMEHIRLGYKVALRTHDPEDLGLIFYSRTNYFFTTGNFQQSKRDGLFSIVYFIKSKKQRWQGICYRQIGDACQKLGEYFQAIAYYNNALEMFSKTGNHANVGIIYTRIAHVYMLMGDLPKELEYSLRALHIREKFGRKDLLGQSMINLGKVLLAMNKYDSSLYYFISGIKILETGSNSCLKAYAYKQLYEFYRKVNNYKNAFIAFQKYQEFNQKSIVEMNKSEINILNTNWLITEMEYNNELLKQENTLKNIQFRNRRIETISFEIGFLVIFFFTLFITNLLNNTRKKRIALGFLNDQLKTEIVERTEAEILMRQSEERYRFLAENLVDVISLLDGDMNRIYVSPSCKKLFGFESYEMVNKKPFDLVDPSSHAHVKERLTVMKQLKKPVRYTFKALRKDGTTFWAESNVNPIFDCNTGKLNEVISVIRDISERKKHEEFISENERQKEILLNEIHNRVKNNFAILFSLMDMQRSLNHDPILDRSFADLQLRVRTMSLVHEQLYLGKGIHVIPFGDYLKNLSMIISSAFKNDRITLHTDIDPCIMAIEMALPLGLIVNELITNAYKYAFRGKLSGNVWVLLKADELDKWSVTIHDDGIGLPPDFSSRTKQTMGSQIINILVQQVEAELKISNTDGACFKILFPIKKA
ncbi:MAG: PAS domain S-box protein [Bacteroidales bacterium]|jgi:PAS domain S-box-containing protein|nr:PAS domain S-box protein [Bacteroidales bacterium]